MSRGVPPGLTPKADCLSAMTHDHWFEGLADHLGSAYLRYSFTKGTVAECDHLVDVLSLDAGMRVLDVGCGPGRHAHELARRGVEVHGIDISQTFVDLATTGAPEGATFERRDARDLIDADDLHGAFDAVICLCQGAFGLMTASDGPRDAERSGVDGNAVVFSGLAACIKTGGRLALSAFSSYFVVQAQANGEYPSDFDADSGVNHERTEIRNPDGVAAEVDLWTACYTPRELRLLCALYGLEAESISSVEPGEYGSDLPHVNSPEFLLVARRM